MLAYKFIIKQKGNVRFGAGCWKAKHAVQTAHYYVSGKEGRFPQAAAPSQSSFVFDTGRYYQII